MTISASTIAPGITVYADTTSASVTTIVASSTAEEALSETIADSTSASSGSASTSSSKSSNSSSGSASTSSSKSNSSSTGSASTSTSTSVSNASSTAGTTASSSTSGEVLLEIGDGPVDDAELGITSDADIAALTDGSMIPEYNITSISETSSNVVTNDYTVAEDSSISETVAETSASSGTDELIEVVDDVDDFSAFKTTYNTVSQGLSNMVSSIIGKSSTSSSTTDSSDTIAVNEVPSSETTSIVSSIVSAVTGSSSSKSSSSPSVPTIATTASRQALINYAKQFLGNPYVFGGTSLTDGADCSGFVQQIFKHFGITTGRSSRDQIEKSQAITFEELQPGDLVFYSSGDYVNHVAIYAGDGVIIHAANSRTGICTGRYDYREPYAYGRFLDN